jgi:hypothetical protein
MVIRQLLAKTQDDMIILFCLPLLFQHLHDLVLRLIEEISYTMMHRDFIITKQQIVCPDCVLEYVEDMLVVSFQVDVI